MHPPIVKIKSDDPDHGGYMVINASDFDETKHERFIEPVAVVPPPPAPPPPPGAPDPLKDLPADWKSQSAGNLRKLAFAIDGRTVENAEQAIAVIEKALAARG